MFESSEQFVEEAKTELIPTQQEISEVPNLNLQDYEVVAKAYLKQIAKVLTFRKSGRGFSYLILQMRNHRENQLIPLLKSLVYALPKTIEQRLSKKLDLALKKMLPLIGGSKVLERELSAKKVLNSSQWCHIDEYMREMKRRIFERCLTDPWYTHEVTVNVARNAAIYKQICDKLDSEGLNLFEA